MIVRQSDGGPVIVGVDGCPLVRSAQSPLVVVARDADGAYALQGTTSPRRMA
jgi:hypothetical protein